MLGRFFTLERGQFSSAPRGAYMLAVERAAREAVTRRTLYRVLNASW